MPRSGPGVVGRIGQVGRLIRSEGVTGVTNRLRTRAAARIAPSASGTSFVDAVQLASAADASQRGWTMPPPLAWGPGEPLRIAWVCAPPGPGSGGHTTLFRMVSALQQAGHHCSLHLMDRHGWALRDHRAVIRDWWPDLTAEVHQLSDGLPDAHAIVATAWTTAFAVLPSQARGVRMYFVQDFEPWFYPAGSDYLLAEATYRFGFHGITAGPWLSQLLETQYSMHAQPFEFGADQETYRLEGATSSGQPRDGVCYYCRPSTPRRAHELAVMALTEFARRHPQAPIHLFGEVVADLPFHATQHGVLTPAGLNDLYNRCVAGLALSATNVSLVPLEMLASGCIPVVNDAVHNRTVLDNEEICYPEASPYALADALGDLVGQQATHVAARALRASRSVSSRSWGSAGEQVEQIITRAVMGAQPA